MFDHSLRFVLFCFFHIFCERRGYNIQIAASSKQLVTVTLMVSVESRWFGSSPSRGLQWAGPEISPDPNADEQGGAVVVGVRKYEIKYSMSALFWSQLPQTDAPHCVHMGWVWVEVCLGGKEEGWDLKKDKNPETPPIIVCYVEQPSSKQLKLFVCGLLICYSLAITTRKS